MSTQAQVDRKRRDELKALIRKLHQGQSVEEVRETLVRTLGEIPYNEVVAAEQELIAEGLPEAEVLRLCNLHTAALKGAIDLSQARKAPAGHPVHVFEEENRALGREVLGIREDVAALANGDPEHDAREAALALLGKLNTLSDVDKHYLRKENLVFPYLEKRGITGPPTVMWGKHDEIRSRLNGAREALVAASQGGSSAAELRAVASLLVEPALAGVEDMIEKEERILLPMCLDTLTEAEWYAVSRQSVEYGFCLVDPDVEWTPSGLSEAERAEVAAGAVGAGDAARIQLPSGVLTAEQLLGILNTLPVDMTFVDADDVVRYFTQGAERIFPRSRAILGRKVQLCHPPSSVHTVERILNDFREGRQDRAAFWIQLHGRFIHIEYFAVRSPQGRFLGTLEVSQDLTEKRKLEGDRRLLTYDEPAPEAAGA